VHRVVTDIQDYRGRRIIEAGPWLTSKEDADSWAEILHAMGYVTRVERMHGTLTGGSSDDDFANALASMA